MAASVIGSVKSGSGKSFQVKWDEADRNVYVSWGGWTKVGATSSAGDAMRKAEAWLYNK